MHFTIKVLTMAVAGSLMFSAAFAQSDYAACRAAAAEYQRASRSYEQSDNSDPMKDEIAKADLKRKYDVYRVAELKWASDLYWLWR